MILEVIYLDDPYRTKQVAVTLFLFQQSLLATKFISYRKFFLHLKNFI